MPQISVEGEKPTHPDQVRLTKKCASLLGKQTHALFCILFYSRILFSEIGHSSINVKTIENYFVCNAVVSLVN
jgi:hypothetical protein